MSGEGFVRCTEVLRGGSDLIALKRGGVDSNVVFAGDREGAVSVGDFMVVGKAGSMRGHR